MASKENKAPLLCYFKLCVSLHSHRSIQTGVTVQKCPIWVKISEFFVPCDLEIWGMTLKNNRAPLLWHFKLCASFHSHWCIQIGVIVWKPPILIKIGSCLSCVTLKIDGWPWKTIGYLFHAISSYVYHFIVIGQLELKLQSGNAQFGPFDLEKQ